MTIPTVQEFTDGKTDLDDLESIVNGSTTVTTRIGGDKLSVDQALSQIIVGQVTEYSAAATYTAIEQWVEYNSAIYRPLPSALPIGPEAFDGGNWAVVQPNGLLPGTFLKEDIAIVDGQLSYSIVTSGLSIIDARLDLAKAGGEADGTLLVAGQDYTIVDASNFTLLRSYPAGVIRVSNLTFGAPSGAQILTVKDFGALGDGVTDDSVAVKAAHDYYVSINSRVGHVPAGTYSVANASEISGVVWIGEGQFTGQLRERVHSQSHYGEDVGTEILPRRHFRRFSEVDSPVVVIMGDSISTEAPTITADESESMWGVIQRRMREDNPDLVFDFQNRAIGESTWSNANPATILSSTPLTLPSWAGAGAQPWLDYVEALGPDVLYLAWGMNDRQNFVTAQFRAVVSDIQTWTKVPDIVFITNMVPSRQSENVNIYSPVAQEGRDFVAGYVRSWANYQGYGYIDLNRQYNICKEGFDVTQSALTRTTPSRISVTLGYTAPADSECADFGWDIDFTNIPAGFWAGSGAGNLRFPLSPAAPDFNNSASWLNIIDNAGFLQIELVDVDDGPGTYLTSTSTIVTPTTGADVNITVFVKSTYLSVKVDGEALYEGNVRRHGGQFLPSVVFTDGFSVGADVFFWQGRYNDNMPRITDLEMWGDNDGGITGGNNENHPTSKGAAVVYWPTFKNTDFRQPVVIEGSTDFPGTTERKVGVRKHDPKGVLHVAKTKATSDIPSANANMLVLEDASSPGMSFISDNTGVSRVNFADQDDDDVGGLRYNHNTDTLSARTGGEDILSLDTTRGVLLAALRFEAEQNTGGTNAANYSMSFDLTSNTNLRIRVRGDDGTVRSADLTLS